MKSERADGCHRLCPVEKRETFFHFQRDGLDVGELQGFTARHPLTFVKGFAFADDRERQMSERREVAARSDRTFFGNDRMNSALKHRNQSFDNERPRATVA